MKGSIKMEYNVLSFCCKEGSKELVRKSFITKDEIEKEIINCTEPDEYIYLLSNTDSKTFRGELEELKEKYTDKFVYMID
jgi:hypothetical protein